MGDIFRFLKEVKFEFLKIVWPKADEFIGSVIIVLILVILFALYLAAIDYGFTQLMTYIFSLYGVYE